MKGFTLALFGLLSVAQAQIAFLPLDSRPTTRILPLLIAELSGKTVAAPPRELLGDAKQGANLEGLKSWLETQNDSEALYIALDALAYGGLVQSRSSTISAEDALKNLEPVRQYAQSGKPIYASITIPRFPDAKNRPRNLEVIEKMLEWAREGVFKELRVTWDDALGGSPAPLEGTKIAKIAPLGVRVYPGADEVLSSLFASSLFASSLAPSPKRLRVVYSDPSKVKNVLPYDGLSLEDSVKLHAESNGFRLFEVVPDLTLYVYNGGDSRKAALDIKELAREGEVSVVDIAKVNVGTPAFWKDLRTLGVFHRLSSLAAWGTPGNNFGTALAQAKLWLEFGNLEQNRNLLAYEYQNDLLYSSVTRFEIRKVFPEAALGSEAARDWLLRRSSRDAQLRFPNGEYVLESIFLPWNRSFEAEGSLELVPSGK